MIYIVNGAPGSGKTTFEHEVLKIMNNSVPIDTCYIYSTIDCIKDIAYQIGWDGVKTPINRKFLSDLKDLLTQFNDYSYRDVYNKIQNKINLIKLHGLNPQFCAFFVDCREPEEIAKFCERLNAKSVFIRRETTKKEIILNHADANVENYKYDIVIDNSGSLEDLGAAAKYFIETEGLYTPIKGKGWN